MGEDSPDDVANIGHALAEIGIFDLREKLAVLIECLLERGASVDMPGQDSISNPADEGRVSQKRAVGTKDFRFRLADLATDPRDQAVQLLGRRRRRGAKRRTSADRSASSR